MSYKEALPRGFFVDPCNLNPHIVWVTKNPGLLHLIYTIATPSFIPIYRVVRGVRRQCGVKTKLWHTECLTQSPPYDGTIHIFELPTFSPGTTIWYVISTQCKRGDKTDLTTVQKLVYPECPTDENFVSLGRGVLSVLNTNFSVPWLYVRAGNSSLWTPPSGDFIEGTGPGTAHCYAIINMRGDHNGVGSCTYRMRIQTNATPKQVIAENSQTMAQGERVTFLASGAGLIGALDDIEVHFDRTSGNITCESICDDHDGIFTVGTTYP